MKFNKENILRKTIEKIYPLLYYLFFRIHKEPGAHYESASTRKFLYGRTETIRSCSVESVVFAKAMLDEDLPVSEKTAALRNAIEAHKNYVKDVSIIVSSL